MILQDGAIILNGKYRIEKLAGKGAFAEVYRATHLELNVPRAIKVLRVDAPGVGSTTFIDYRDRYKQEFQIAARLDHPNVIKVYDLIEEQGALYAVLEFAPNGSVKDMMVQRGMLLIEHATRILLDCAAGLDALHEKLGVIHRDIKPSNILLDADGRAKIADLGLAQVGSGQSSMRSELGSAAGAHPGTQHYRSPEHNTWEPLTPTSDVYSLGSVAFEMLTGQAWKFAMRKAEHVHELRPDVPVWLDAIVARMLCDMPGLRKSDADNPQKRYVTMSAVANAVREEVDSAARQNREAEARAKHKAEERKRKEAEEQARHEIEAQARHERERREQREADEKANREALAKKVAEEKAQQEAEREEERKREEPARIERERRAREETERRYKWLARILVGALVAAGIGWLVSNFSSAPAPALVATRVASSASGNPAMLPTPPTNTVAPTGTPQPVSASPTSTVIPETSTPKPAATATLKPTIPAARIGDSRSFAPDNAPMMAVPAGEFSMGNNDDHISFQPEHTVYLDAYWMDKFEVTNTQYASCLNAGKCTHPNQTSSRTRNAYFGNAQFNNYPVIYVNSEQAKTYCEWAGKRLPTEAEWEKAARGTDGRLYPWGNSFDVSKLNSREGGKGDTMPVGSYPDGASPYGVMDMAGNVWEWVADWFGGYLGGLQRNPTGPRSG